jgi:hypothetical protein
MPLALPLAPRVIFGSSRTGMLLPVYDMTLLALPIVAGVLTAALIGTVVDVRVDGDEATGVSEVEGEVTVGAGVRASRHPSHVSGWPRARFASYRLHAWRRFGADRAPDARQPYARPPRHTSRGSKGMSPARDLRLRLSAGLPFMGRFFMGWPPHHHPGNGASRDLEDSEPHENTWFPAIRLTRLMRVVRVLTPSQKCEKANRLLA